MSSYETVIGLEVHVHLSTRSKLFCSCPTTFGVEPNTNVCEVCAGMPGVLPCSNQTAVEYATKAGLALNCTINNDSVFARKNYFYPDMPFNYQISQFERPLCEFGHLDITVDGKTKRIGITRIHMETDAGKNIHEGDHSYVDLNRAAVPLIEIVSEPDMRSPGRGCGLPEGAATPSWSISALPTEIWKKAASAATPTYPSGHAAPRSSAHARN